MIIAPKSKGSVNKVRCLGWSAALFIGYAVQISFAFADEVNDRHDLNIKATSLGEAMDLLVEQAGVQLLYPYDSANTTGLKPVIGQYTLGEALEKMFHDTIFSAGLTEDGIVTVSITKAKKKPEGNMDNTTIRKGLAVGASALYLGGVIQPPALAQTANQVDEGANEAEQILEEKSIDEIIVTANRREQTILDVDASVTAFQQEFIESRSIDNIEDLLLLTPGVTFSDAEGTGRQNNVTIRGVTRSGTSTATTGIYLDDVPLTFDAGRTEPVIRTFDLQRVEVLRGPQGTLFGAGAMGGAVRYISNAPDASETSGQIRLDGATTKDGSESYAIDGVINLPLSEDKLALRIAGSYEETGGFIDLPNLANGPIEDADEGRLESIRGVLRYTPKDALTIDLQAWFQNSENDGFNTASITPTSTASDLSDVTQTRELTTAGFDFEQYSAVINYDFDWATLISTTSNIQTDSFVNRRDDFGSNSTQDVDVFTQEIRLVSNDEGPFLWSTGLFYQDGDSATAFESTAGFGTGNVVVDRSQWALFGEAQYEVIKDIQALVGIRYFESDGTASNVSDNPFAGMTSLNGNFEEDGKVLLKFGLSYSGVDNLNLYATASEGFREAGANTISSAGIQAGFPTTFESDSIWAYEAGAKFNAFDDRLFGAVAGFYNDWENIQVADRDFFLGDIFLDNAGSAHIAGIEAELSFDVTDNLTLGANGSILEARIDETVAAARVTDGDTISGVPEESAAFFVSYETPASFISNDWKFTLTSNLSYSGKTLTRSQDVDRESRWNLGARAGFRSDNYEVAIYARNLTNDDTSLGGFFNPFTGNTIFSPQRPRTIGVELVGRY